MLDFYQHPLCKREYGHWGIHWFQPDTTYPIQYMHDIFNNEHLTLWIEVSVGFDRKRTHYFRVVDKMDNITHEVEMTDEQLDKFRKELGVYRHV